MTYNSATIISKERLMDIKKGAIFTRKRGFFYVPNYYLGESFTRRETEPSGRIIAVTHKEVDGVKIPKAYVAELGRDIPVVSGLIERDFQIDDDSGQLIFIGDLREKQTP